MLKFMRVIVVLMMVGMLLPTHVDAHCDTMDGPVIKAAQQALGNGNVNLVLIWVKADDEAAIKEAFEKALRVRKLSPEAQEMADMYFFETLVRIHRAGEGAPYTGLKPTGTPLEPGVAIADAALANGSDAELLKELAAAVQKGAQERFREVMEKKQYPPDNIEAGREYIEQYVVFVHYIEGLFQAAEQLPQGHVHEAEQHKTEHHETE